MIKWLLHRGVRRLERDYDYDARYMHEIIDVSARSGLRLAALPLLSQYRGPDPGLWAGACLASTLDGDCGPCAQLIVDMAREAGLDAATLHALLAGDPEDAGTAGLGFRFAQAAILGDPAIEDLRAEIVSSLGERALVAATYAAATGRVYPVLKRAMGHGAACQVLRIGDGQDVPIRRRS